MRTAVIVLWVAMTAGCASTPTQPPRAAVAFTTDTIVASEAGGVADPATGRIASPNDPVRIASISKLVTAIGAMMLVEEGRLSLDAPVGDVLGYPVAHPAAPRTPVTLRQLLSHTSGVRDGAGYAIPLGDTLRDRLADPAAWSAEPREGYFSYSNLNFVIVASAMEAATGERFDRLMDRLLFAPMGLDACFNWAGCSDATIARAIVLQREGVPVWDDLGGRRPDCPVVVKDGEPCDLSRWRPGENGALFSPQGGLRIGAEDLAQIGRLLLGRGTTGGRTYLSPDLFDRMVAPQWNYDGTNGDTWSGVFCRYGLGVHLLQSPGAECADDPGLPLGRWAGHSGDAYGLRSGLWVDLENPRGIAWHIGGEPELSDDETSWIQGFLPVEKEMTARALDLFEGADR
ncbi:serine hydrolase domain-containing protein [Sphingomicrobium sp. XHP0239]|uniref:serine hydrolase domain-containing protein n=1 Tax=Sphingomicrobium maritimum TaxID=3133972 RepID=UPI0031CCA3C5